MEALEKRRLLAAEIMISEFLASNDSAFVDAQGRSSDWIELHNAGDTSADLTGWYLTDTPEELDLWQIPAGPSSVLGPGDYLVVFASGDGVPDSNGSLHTNFSLAADGDYVALVQPDLSIHSEFGTGQTEYPKQRTDISYGIDPNVLSGDATRYFLTPTPGAANTDPIQGFVKDTQFSVGRGYFDASFTVDVTSATPGATIVYTTDGSEPSLTNGTQVFVDNATPPTASVAINTTTTLRAAAFKPDFQPTNIDTQTYLFTADVIQQSNTPAGYPTTWPGAPGADYEMDPEITTDPAYLSDLLAGLQDLPALALSSEIDGIFGVSGIYTNPQNDNLEIPVSAEYLLADGTSGFQIDAGLKVAGGASRNPNNSPKHSMSLRFRAEYGDSKLQYDLFDGSPVDTFNSLQLRAVYNNSWIHWNQGQRGRGTLIRDQFIRDSLLAAGQDDAGRGHYTHVYINGLYWGVYNLHERAESSHFAEHNGGDADDYDALNGGAPIDGTIDSWNAAKSAAAAGDWNAVQQAIDIDNFIDFSLVQAYGGNADLKTNGNWRAAGGGSANAPWRMYAWDSERTLEGITAKPPNTITDATGMFNDLMAIEEFRVRYGDRAQKHLTGDGAFTPDKSIERWNARVAELQLAIVAESARWGDYRRDVHPRGATPLLYSRDSTWIPEVTRVATSYLPARSDFVYDQLVSLEWIPPTVTPAFRVNGGANPGGIVAAGSELRLAAPEGDIYYTLDGSDPRLEGGAISPTAILYDNTTSDTALISAGSSWNYFDGGGDLGTAWRSPSFNDSTWSSGNAELGYGDGDEATVVSFGGNPSNKHTTTYFRKDITISSLDYDSVTLRVRRDDGIVIYVNGQEIGRDNLPTGQILFNTFATRAAPDDGTDWITFDVPMELLQIGSNLIAAEVHQNSLTSSDLSFDLELFGQQQTAPPINLDETKFLKTRARTTSGDWSAVNEGLFQVLGEPASSSNLRITEVHFNPSGDAGAEYIEIQNVSDLALVDLDGAKVTDGPSDPFVFPVNTNLLPGAYGLLVRDPAAFTAAFPTVDPSIILGTYEGKLSDGGEQIRIEDAAGIEIADLTYNDADPWPRWSDGFGGSLVLDNPADIDASESGKPYHYRGSRELGGSPGAPSNALSGIVINEVLSHTDAPLLDSIELFNTTDAAIDISGWYLSDDGDLLQKYQIPQATVLPAGGFLVFDESEFNPLVPANGSLIPFALNGSEGDSVWLMEGSSNTVVGFADQVSFGATFNGRSLGRIAGSQGRLVPLANRSLGTINGTFQSSDIVISEVNYHPAPPNAAAVALDPTISSSDLEFIELHNESASAIDLTDWRLRGEGDFDFPATTTIATDTTLVVVSFDPGDPAQAARTNAFRAHYGIDANVDLIGPFSGSLSNSHGLVKLQAPDAPPADNPTLTPNVLVDELFYDDLAPWPTNSDGQGASLQRLGGSSLGVHWASWRGESPTPGEIAVRAKVESVTINDGQSSRSQVTRIEVVFDQEVSAPASAFQISDRATGVSVENIQVNQSTVQGKTVATLTFQPGTLVVTQTNGNHSLADGNYELNVIASQVQTVASGAAMASDHQFGQTASDNFFRFFGDSDGDRDVDGLDLGAFGQTFLKTSEDTEYNSALDFDGDGDVDGLDLGAFGQAFLDTLDFPSS